MPDEMITDNSIPEHGRVWLAIHRLWRGCVQTRALSSRPCGGAFPFGKVDGRNMIYEPRGRVRNSCVDMRHTCDMRLQLDHVTSTTQTYHACLTLPVLSPDLAIYHPQAYLITSDQPPQLLFIGQSTTISADALHDAVELITSEIKLSVFESEANCPHRRSFDHSLLDRLVSLITNHTLTKKTEHSERICSKHMRSWRHLACSRNGGGSLKIRGTLRVSNSP